MSATIEEMKVIFKTGFYRDFHIKPLNCYGCDSAKPKDENLYPFPR
ncbi:hypothetical protein MTBBW1_1940088 [Desulfamplus magnetovallimortis]|uniref:Uncharacterized protein n=1 Tax=Desulfamplus magnetovallimortis TaxID=1246637 RepID=A0A1W1HB78_9BACT|nr:hypothetical protein MTBBW1_1940088 [Desulfamplus magnetovallimortis]